MRARSAVVPALAAGMLAAVLAVPERAPAEPPAYQRYFAGMHNHTGYSDGVPLTTPADAYAKARLWAQDPLDIMTVTEHSEAFSVPTTFSEQCLPHEGGTLVECALADPGTPANSFRKWEANGGYAEEATDASFLGLRGFEWTSDVFDHINVYFSSEYTNAKADGGYATMDTFWRWFGSHDDALGTFNHPGDKEQPDTGKPWNDFEYVPDADLRMVGIEVFNGGKGKDYFNRNGINYIAKALDRGWHLGLVGAQDTHTDDWGDPTKYARTAFLAPSLSRTSIREAMLARRFYATTDANLDVDFTANGLPMGTRLRVTAGEQVALSASATDPDGEAIEKIELFTNGGTKVAEATASPADFTVNSDWGEEWYLVRVTQADGEKAYSSPIWIGANVHPYGEWLAGDLHVHTELSHDTCHAEDPTTNADGDLCDEPWTWSFTVAERIALAKERGLDYLAITDHNNIRSQHEDAWLEERSLTLVPAYENSFPHSAHAQMLGATHCYGISTTGFDCSNPPSEVDPDGGAIEEATALYAEGGAFQMNHPGDGKLGWRAPAYAGLVPGSVEVWNIGAWYYQPPALASNDNDDALAFWEGFLSAGHRVAATGGSDSHWRLTSSRQGIGQPTTWVYSAERSWQGVVGGIRSGATTISHEPPAPGAPRIFLEADADENGTFESMAGDTVPILDRVLYDGAVVRIGPPMRVRVENAPPGSFVRTVEYSSGGTGQGTQIAPFTGTFQTQARWIRAELLVPQDPDAREVTCDPIVGDYTTYCRNRLVVLALTSAIYQV